MSSIFDRVSEILRREWNKVSAHMQDAQVVFEVGDKVFDRTDPYRVGEIEKIISPGDRNFMTMQWINAPNYGVKFYDNDDLEIISGRRLIDASGVQNPQWHMSL